MSNVLKMNRLTQWLNKQGQSLYEYQEHEDNIDKYVEIFESHSLFFDDVDDDLKEVAEKVLSGLDACEILELCDEPFLHYGCSRCSGEIWSVNIGEVECQLTGIYEKINNKEINCIYTELCKDLSESEIQEAKNDCDYCIHEDLLFLSDEYNRVSICLNTDKFKKYCKDNKISID